MIELCEVHGPQEERGPPSATGDGPAGLTATKNLKSVLCGLDT